MKLIQRMGAALLLLGLPAPVWATVAEDIRRGPSLEMSSVQLTYDVPLSSRRSSVRMDLCIPKDVGTLDINLDTAILGLPSFTIPFTGAEASPGGSTLVWTSNATINRCVNMPGYGDVKIKTVTGRLTGNFAAQRDPVAGVCRADHAERFSVVGGDPDPNNFLTIEVDSGCSGVVFGGTVRVQNIQISGLGGQHVPEVAPTLASVGLNPSGLCRAPITPRSLGGTVQLSGNAARVGFPIHLSVNDPLITLSRTDFIIPRDTSADRFSATVPAGYTGTFVVTATVPGTTQTATRTFNSGLDNPALCLEAEIYRLLPRYPWEYCAACAFGKFDVWSDPAVRIISDLPGANGTTVLGGVTRANGLGQQVGYFQSPNGARVGFAQGLNGKQGLDGYQQLANASFSDLSETGIAVGYSLNPAQQHTAIRFDGNSQVALGALGGSQSEATAVNSDGIVAGWAHDTKGVPRAFFYRAGKMTQLPLGAFASSAAVAINDVGQVSGNAVDIKGALSGFVYEVSTGKMTMLAAPQGYASLVVSDLSADGTVVGTLYSGAVGSSASTAFRYTASSGVKLLDAMLEKGSTYKTTGAFAIGPGGEILTSGQNNQSATSLVVVPQ